MCRIVVLHGAACCSLTDLCDAVPQTVRYSAQTSRGDSNARCVTRSARESRALELEAVICSQSSKAASQADSFLRRSEVSGGALER